jgi:DNA repair exonuclease SbcCD nuclease subunit
MEFRFIHTADWQLAKPFANMPAQLAGELAAARLGIIVRVAAIARAEGAAHAVVAGDVFDGDLIETVVIRRALEQLRQEAGITWALLPGNHDPARAGGLWERIARIGVPDNVVVLTESKPFALVPEAVILPAPLTSKNPGRDPTDWMDHAETAPGVLRIGLAHGSVHGFGSEGESSVPLARDRAARAGLAYLALGDWHGAKQIDARTWYSGTPEPDRFKENDTGNVLAVSIDGLAPPVVKKIASAHFNWVQMTSVIRSIGDLQTIERKVTVSPDTSSRVLLSLTLSGALTLSEYAELESWKQTIEGRLRHLELDETGLAVTASGGDLESFGSLAGQEGAQGGVLTVAARRLAAIARDAAHPQRAAADLALRRLYAFAAEEREAGS